MYDSMLLAAQTTNITAEELFDLHRGYDKIFADTPKFNRRKGAKIGGRKIKIGYISPDFRRHVMFNFIYGLLSCHDSNKFELFCYYTGEIEDGFTAHLKTFAEHFYHVPSLSIEELAKKIYDDGLDILVDLAGHSSGGSLPVLAYRPAPVQISGLGYLDTTGLGAVDYLITDKIVNPPGSERFLTEKPLYLPCQFSYVGRNDVPVSKGAPCLGRGYVTFGVFNHYRKITDEMLCCWQKIMELTPNSYLLLKSAILGDDRAADMAYERLQKFGFDTDRIVFEGAEEEYLPRYLDVDIALDTYPYTGGGTTFDALYMGVPVVSRYGQRRSSRFGLSVLDAAGLSELAADSADSYVEKAVALANDAELLDVLHKNLRGMLQNSPALSPKNYTRNLEREYLQILGRDYE